MGVLYTSACLWPLCICKSRKSYPFPVRGITFKKQTQILIKWKISGPLNKSACVGVHLHIQTVVLSQCNFISRVGQSLRFSPILTGSLEIITRPFILQAGFKI